MYCSSPLRLPFFNRLYPFVIVYCFNRPLSLAWNSENRRHLLAEQPGKPIHICIMHCVNVWDFPVIVSVLIVGGRIKINCNIINHNNRISCKLMHLLYYIPIELSCIWPCYECSTSVHSNCTLVPTHTWHVCLYALSAHHSGLSCSHSI